MGGFVRQHAGVVLLSVFLHGSVLALLVYAERFTERTPIARQIAIEATVVDESLIQREIERLDRLEQEEVRRQQEQERLARERAEVARSELEAEQRRLEAVRQQQQEEQQQSATAGPAHTRWRACALHAGGTQYRITPRRPLSVDRGSHCIARRQHRRVLFWC